MQLPPPRRSWLGRALGLLVLPSVLVAQGFGVNEISSCAVARGYAATAGGCNDASSIYWNPAGTTNLPGWAMLVGVSTISINGAFLQDTTGRTYKSTAPTAVVPSVFLNYTPAASNLSYGVGVYVPYGLTSEWGNDFPGRFVSEKASLTTVYVQPNIAYRFNPRWSLGVGPIFAHSTVELNQALDLSQQSIPGFGTTPFSALGIAPRTEFADAHVKGSGNGYGVHVGLLGKVTDHLSFGARFMSSIVIKYDDADATFSQVATNLTLGGAVPNPANPAGPPAIPAGTPVDQLVASQFTSGGALTSQTASTRISHPAQAQAGLDYTGFNRWDLEADVAWVGWKQFTDLPITFNGNANANSRVLLEQYNNSTSFRIGAQYSLMNDWRLRAGFSGAAAASPDVTVTPLLPEQDRAYFTGGLGIPLIHNVMLDASYAHIYTPGRRGRIDERTKTTQGVELNSGVYTLNANVFSFSLKASF